MQPGTLFWWLKTAESIIPYIIIYINPQTVDEKKSYNYNMYFRLKRTSTNSSQFNRSVIPRFTFLQVKHKIKIDKVKLLCIKIIFYDFLYIC